MSQKHRQLVNVAELDWVVQENGDTFRVERKQLGAKAQGQRLGCSLLRLGPGKRAWPKHYHLANEEAIFILKGSGLLRIGEREVPVRTGDYIALPVGAEFAHQLTNNGRESLEYLCMSTMIEPDVMGYPDSGKIGVAAGAAPGGDRAKRTLLKFFPQDADVPYWKDEG